jgi:GR25 family glycosyltransferase involved in LPS biosynthesis
MMATPSGCYINLERSPERAAFMQEQLERLGMAWVQRHLAVDAEQVEKPPACPLLPGEYACFPSHLQALELSQPGAFHLVLEDDTELGDQLPALLADAAFLQAAAGHDLVFLECQPKISLTAFAQLWELAGRHLTPSAGGAQRHATGFDLIDARPHYLWSAAAYLVTPQGRERVLALMRQWLEHGPKLPVDRCFERAMALNALRAGLVLPFLATTGLQWHGRSAIGNGPRVPQDPLMAMRRLLFAGPLAEAGALRGPLVAGAPADAELRLLGSVLAEVAAGQRAAARGTGPAG